MSNFPCTKPYFGNVSTPMISSTYVNLLMWLCNHDGGTKNQWLKFYYGFRHYTRSSLSSMFSAMKKKGLIKYSLNTKGWSLTKKGGDVMMLGIVNTSNSVGNPKCRLTKVRL